MEQGQGREAGAGEGPAKGARPKEAPEKAPAAQVGPEGPPRKKGRPGGLSRPPRDCDASSSPSRGVLRLEPVLLHLALERLERAVRRLGDGHEVLDVPRLGQPARRCYPDLVRPCRGPV